MPLYVFNLYGAYCGLIKARTLEAGKRRALREEGSRNLQSVRLATKEDIDNHRAMGGHVPGEKE